MAAKKNQKQKNDDKKLSSQAGNRNSLKPEIVSIIIIGICILVIISVFSGNGKINDDFSENAIGFLGGIVCWTLKGIFGIGAYVLPFEVICFCSSAFFSETKKIKLSKFIMGISLFLILISFMHLVGENSGKSAAECFNQGGPLNGGFLGCIVGKTLYDVFGFGTYIIFIILAIILAVLITGKSFLIFLRDCYRKSKDSFEKDTLIRYDDDDDFEDVQEPVNDDDGFDEKKNRKISKKWSGSLKKDDSERKKSYLGKRVVRHNGKIVSINIPERSDKSGKNKISLFTDELKKYKKKSNMPSFLKNNQFESALADETVLTAENLSDDDMFDENFVIRGFVDGYEQQSFPLDNQMDYSQYDNVQQVYSEQPVYDETQIYSEQPVYDEQIKKESIFDSLEFQEKIVENFKERFREDIEYNYSVERNADLDSDEESQNYQEDFSEINDNQDYRETNDINENEDDVLKSYEDNKNEDDVLKSYEDNKNEDDVLKSYEDNENENDVLKSYEGNENESDVLKSYEDNKNEDDVLKSYEDSDNESDVLKSYEDNESFYYDEFESGKNKNDVSDFDFPPDGVIFDDMENDENLRQAISDYFNGGSATSFEPAKFEDNISYNKIEDNKKISSSDSVRSFEPKEKNVPVSVEYNQREREKNAASVLSDDEPKIFQAEKQVLVRENKSQKSIPKKEYVFPPMSFLEKNPVTPNQSSREEIIENSRILVKTLKSFNIESKVNEISKGPTVTRYELSPGEGVKVSKILGLADNLALSLAAKSIRIEAPIPGKAAVGIEIPNKEVTSVYLSEVVCDKVFQDFPSKLAFGLGKDITGNVIVADIAKMPHMLIAGRTGSGKSVCINTLITSILYKSSPDEVKLIMVDPKVVELSVYNGIPHLLIPVVTDPQKAAGALNWAVSEMMVRYDLFASTGVRNLKGYNGYCEENKLPKIPQIIIIIDELADLMMAASKEVEGAICRLAQLARAAGIHLIIATQRPSVDVITGLIKANIPSRIAFAVSSATDSRTILDMGGADKLLGMGDMLFKSVSVDSDKPIRIQGAFVSDKEVEKIVSFIKENNPVVYDENLIEKITTTSSSSSKGGDSDSNGSDELTDKAIEFVVKKGSASGSMLQRKFKIGYNRAARIIEELEERGIIGHDTGTSKPRAVLMNRYEYEDYMERRRDYI